MARKGRLKLFFSQKSSIYCYYNGNAAYVKISHTKKKDIKKNYSQLKLFNNDHY